MKALNLFLILIFFFPCQAQENVLKNQGRYEKIINSNWTFNYFPDKSTGTGFESPGFDDSGWMAISIPHTWSTFETTGEIHPFIRNASEKDSPYWWTGWGWYRKHFTINKEYKDKKIFVEFEGVQKYCKIWINGKYIGDHKGGYGSFDFDLTNFIKPGEDNVLAVAVNNKMNDEYMIPPMAAGNFDVYGGIYRDVTLVLKNNLYIPMQGSAIHEGGTFVTTPKVSEKSAVARVQTWVKNDYTVPKECTLITTVTDASGKPVTSITSNAQIKPGELFRFDQTLKPISNPVLWSPENPYIYKVSSKVMTGKTVSDVYTSPLGFRWFKWDYKEDFLYVNGKKILIHGGNRHQEYPWLGDALPKWITLMDFHDIAVNLNYNFMRTAHYPNDRLVYDLTDKYGIVVDEESPSIKNQVFSAEVQEQQMKEMIRRDRNHPSIMIWSMGNETNHAVDSKFAIAEDTTRILTARRVTEGSAGAYVKHTDENLAIENLLRCTIRGWYNKDVKDLEPSDSQHSGTEEHQQNMLIASNRFGKANLCTWLYEDHGADREYLNSPLLHVNPKGYVDAYRVPKYAYYFWQANYAKDPMVFILPHFWRSQYIGQKKDIVIDSNCDTVELFINGTSIGKQFPDENNFHCITFKDVLVQKGDILATGRKDGKSVKTSLTTAGEPARIILTASHTSIPAERSSVVVVKADIVDRDGNHIYGATNTLKWSVSGPATLVGPEIYESDINKHHSMDGTMYTDAPVSNLVRSNGQAGKIKITVSASGIASGSAELSANQVIADNSVFKEPVLSNEGRFKPVKNNKTGSETFAIPEVMKYSLDEFNLKPATREQYKKFLRDYVKKNNPALDSSSIEFRAVTDLFATQMSNNSGRMIADDYNFTVDHFNKYVLISKSIDKTGLPEVFRKCMKNNYALDLISRGMSKDIREELDMIGKIPVKGTIVFVKTDNNVVDESGKVIAQKAELEDIVNALNPEYKNLNEEEKTKSLEYYEKLNPAIIVSYISEQSREGDKKKVTNTVYTINKDEPVWIPASNVNK